MKITLELLLKSILITCKDDNRWLMWIFQFPLSSFLTKEKHIIAIRTVSLKSEQPYFRTVSIKINERVKTTFEDGKQYKEMSEYDFNWF